MNFLIERQFHRVAWGLEFRFWRIDRRERHATAGIDNVLNETQRMPLLFLGLLEKMLRKLRKCLRREMRADRVILQLRAELVTDLLVNRVNDFLAGKHRQTLLLIAPMQRLGCVRRGHSALPNRYLRKGLVQKKIDAKHTARVAKQDLKREDNIG